MDIPVRNIRFLLIVAATTAGAQTSVPIHQVDPILASSTENVGQAIELVKPFAVDVVTGVEADPGRKDHGKVEAFLEAAGASQPAGASTR